MSEAGEFFGSARIKYCLFEYHLIRRTNLNVQTGMKVNAKTGRYSLIVRAMGTHQLNQSQLDLSDSNNGTQSNLTVEYVPEAAVHEQVSQWHVCT